MELRHLKYFLAVAETQNIRLAAQKVHVTQPAISRKIKELEAELGVQLFDRLPRGLCLNRAGKVYQTQLGAVLRQIEDANAKVRQFAQTEYGALALGVPDFVLWEGQVTESLNQFRDDNLAVELEIFSDTPMVLLKRLELEQIDAAFLYCCPPLSKEYEVTVVSDDDLVLAYPLAWQAQMANDMTIDALNQFPAVRLTRSADPHYHDWQQALFEDIGWKPSMTQWAHGESTILGMVAAGSGVAMVNQRHFSSRQSERIGYMPLNIFAQSIALNLIYKRSSDNPALAKFLELMPTKPS